MKEFQCGSPECSTQFTAADREELLREIAEHVKTKHNVKAPSESLLSYLEATAVRDK